MQKLHNNTTVSSTCSQLERQNTTRKKKKVISFFSATGQWNNHSWLRWLMLLLSIWQILANLRWPFLIYLYQQCTSSLKERFNWKTFRIRARVRAKTWPRIREILSRTWIITNQKTTDRKVSWNKWLKLCTFHEAMLLLPCGTKLLRVLIFASFFPRSAKTLLAKLYLQTPHAQCTILLMPCT